MLGRKPRVGLFVTCLVDLVRPSIGFAAVKLLERAGCAVEVPPSQTCCGQPAYNSGDRGDAVALARQTIAAFEDMDYLVAPSGSCAGMIRKHYPLLFQEGSDDRFRAEALAQRSHELVSFLVDVMGDADIEADYPKVVTYHDSCSGLRELDIRSQPRRLLAKVRGLEVAEMKDAEVCCGFGGTFCVKYPEISNDMVRKKAANVAASGAEALLAGDLGCLMNMAGKLSREGSDIEVRHVAEVLAGETDAPAIGRGDPA
jgi:L-lactate dehydrogenase complex protein LldE